MMAPGSKQSGHGSNGAPTDLIIPAYVRRPLSFAISINQYDISRENLQLI